MTTSSAESPKVFISYTHDSPEHRAMNACHVPYEPVRLSLICIRAIIHVFILL